MAFCYYAEVKRDDNGELFIERVINPELAPVIHAHWIDYGEVVECSHCEWYARFETHYCPNCGAIMDEVIGE